METIETLEQQLIEQILSYNPDGDINIIRSAVAFGRDKHILQKRASGEPYFIHPLHVALILAEKRLDYATILTGLLHDTVEDTDATLAELEEKFGKDVAFLVNGVTKIDEVNAEYSKQDLNGENLRKLLLNSLQDIRVLIVKLADRLHNMRTIGHVGSAKKREQKARETIEIYVPLADQIGLKYWGEELANCSFEILQPKRYEYITNKLNELYKAEEVKRIINDLEIIMGHLTLDYIPKIVGRQKSPFSIYNKMNNKNVDVGNLSDIFAFRIITKSTEDCYRALFKVHEHCRIVPGRFKDYISSPKHNGYQSLHTIVIEKGGTKIEVQIRTENMHELAEYGIAAHWAYKQGRELEKARKNSLEKIKQIIDLADEGKKGVDFTESAKLELYKDKIFVFTPKNKMIELPTGATVLDFAYSIHEQKVGPKFHYAKVNGVERVINYALRTGDTVEIITRDHAEPREEWLNFVATHRARSAIQKRLRELRSELNIARGRDEIYRLLNEYGLTIRKSHLMALYKQIKVQNSRMIFQRVGEGEWQAIDIILKMFPHFKIPDNRTMHQNTNPIIVNDFTPDAGIKFSECCLPIPGDIITGFINLGNILTIHRHECPKLVHYQQFNERFRPVRWEKRKNYYHVFTTQLTCDLGNRTGMLAKLTNVIAEFGSNITDMQFVNKGTDIYHILFEVEIADVTQCNDLIKKLQLVSGVNKVSRVIGL